MSSCSAFGVLPAVCLFASALTAQVFSSPGIQIFPGSGRANDVKMADFNGDGKLDLAVVYVLDGVGTGNVTVYLGDGHGGFSSGNSFATGNNPWTVVTGDFNSDGKLDMAVCNDGAANYQPDSISIFLGNGGGSFTSAPGSPIALPSNTGPLSLAVADFNRDGKPDLVSANLHNQTMSVFLGAGDGTFATAPGSPLAVPIQPWSVAVADFNGDGKMDAVVGSYNEGVEVLLGDGGGRLTPAAGTPLSVGWMPERVAVGDFDGDGKADLAIANMDVTFIWPDYGNVTVLLGNGDGTFRPSGNGQFPVPREVITVAVADFNQDGKLDIAAIGFTDYITLMLGDGAGHFTQASGSPVTGGGINNNVAVGDLDGDGTPDIVVSSGVMYLNQSKPPVFQVAKSHAGDFMQDTIGTYTITVGNQAGAGPTRGTVTVTEIAPAGLTPLTMTGSGWTCTPTTCSRDNLLANGQSYPPITVRVAVALGAPSQVTNVVSVASSGAVTVTASDATIIHKVPQTISFSGLPPRTYGAAPFSLTATSTSGLAVLFASVTPGTCAVSGTTVSIAAAGTCAIAASQPGSAVYDVAPVVTQSFSINKAPLMVTAENKVAAYGAPLALTASLAGFVNGDSAAAVSGSAALSSNATTTNGRPNAGAWTITPSIGTLSAANYTFSSFIDGTLTVNKAQLTVAPSNASKVYGAPIPVFASAMTGFVNGDTAAVVSGAPLLSTVAAATSSPGAYPILGSAGTLLAANYTFSFVDGVLTVSKALTATFLALSGNTMVARVGVIGPGAGVPTGSVEFRNGGAVLGSIPLSAPSVSFPVAPQGSNTAAYSGDINFVASSSSELTVYPPRTTSLTLTGGPNPSQLGQSVIFTASIAADGGPPMSQGPTGSVRFLDGARLLGSGSVIRGQANLSTTALAGGVHNILAEYSGDGLWPPASATWTHNVNAPVILSVAISPAAPVLGQSVVVTASLAATAVPGGFSAPTGQITFTAPGATVFSPPVMLGAAPLTSGAASLTLANLPVGTQTVTANYSGDGTWSPTSNFVTFVVAPATVSIAASLTTNGGEFVLGATVSSGATVSTKPTGVVQFVDGVSGAVVASAPVSENMASARLPIAAEASVTGRPIAAVYSGDSNFQGGRSVPLPVLTGAASRSSAILAPDEIASAFGVAGLSGDLTPAGPLPASLLGAAVKMVDSAGAEHAALLYGVFASAGQINFLVPSMTAGLANVSITIPGRPDMRTVLRVSPVAPGLFTADMTGDGPFVGQQIYAHSDGSQRSAESCVLDPASKSMASNPIRLDVSGDRVYLVLYGSGIRHATAVNARINGMDIPVTWFGAQAAYLGLDQINIGPLPSSLAGAGTVKIAISADGQPANVATAVVQ